jgi:hypothetical protein
MNSHFSKRGERRMSSLTYLIPTIGRASLERTLGSLELLPGDDVLVVCAEDVFLSVHQAIVSSRLPFYPRIATCPRGNDWGHSERNFAMPLVRTSYMAHIDDDDWYVPGVRTLFSRAMQEAPMRPAVFRMQYPSGMQLWRDREVRCGNVGTPMVLVPNVPERLGRWEPYVGGDFRFLESSKWPFSEYVWYEEVVAMLGHDV